MQAQCNETNNKRMVDYDCYCTMLFILEQDDGAELGKHLGVTVLLKLTTARPAFS